ncbi:MAG TPA: hypothetical protein VKU00_00840, partial [Chthonomonadaceae bacterium]|nr:hypothetical protein [Chthonomonadaceae bacterium]
MSRSLHTQKLEQRAERRLARPHSRRRDEAALLAGRNGQEAEAPMLERRLPIRVQKPLPGTLHPLTSRDIRGL